MPHSTWPLKTQASAVRFKAINALFLPRGIIIPIYSGHSSKSIWHLPEKDLTVWLRYVWGVGQYWINERERYVEADAAECCSLNFDIQRNSEIKEIL